MLPCRPIIGVRRLQQPPTCSTGAPLLLSETPFPIFASVTPIPLMITCVSSIACVILTCRLLLHISLCRARQPVSFWDIHLIIRDVAVSTFLRVALSYRDMLCLMSPLFPLPVRLTHPPPAPLISYSDTIWMLHRCLLIMQLVALLRLLRLP